MSIYLETWIQFSFESDYIRYQQILLITSCEWWHRCVVTQARKSRNAVTDLFKLKHNTSIEPRTLFGLGWYLHSESRVSDHELEKDRASEREKHMNGKHFHRIGAVSVDFPRFRFFHLAIELKNHIELCISDAIQSFIEPQCFRLD